MLAVLKMFSKPTAMIHTILTAVLHLVAVATPSMEAKANRIPKDVSWYACIKLLQDRNILDTLMAIPSYIPKGQIPVRCIRAAGDVVRSIDGGRRQFNLVKLL